MRENSREIKARSRWFNKHLDLAFISLEFSLILLLCLFILESGKFPTLFFQLINIISSGDNYLTTLILISKNFFLFSEASFLIATSSYFIVTCVLRFLKELELFKVLSLFFYIIIFVSPRISCPYCLWWCLSFIILV